MICNTLNLYPLTAFPFWHAFFMTMSKDWVMQTNQTNQLAESTENALGRPSVYSDIHPVNGQLALDDEDEDEDETEEDDLILGDEDELEGDEEEFEVDLDEDVDPDDVDEDDLVIDPDDDGDEDDDL